MVYDDDTDNIQDNCDSDNEDEINDEGEIPDRTNYGKRKKKKTKKKSKQKRNKKHKSK